jgi:hypothetical protein
MAGVIGIGEWAAAGRLTLESFPPGSECGEDEAQVSTIPPLIVVKQHPTLAPLLAPPNTSPQRLVELSENCCDHVVVIDASNGDISPIFAAVRSHNPAVGFTSISTDDDLEDNANIKCSFAHDVSSAGYALAAATALCIKTDSEGGAMSPAEIITACLPSPAAETELLRRLLPEPDLSPVSVLEKVISIVAPTEPTSSTTLDPTTPEEWAALRASSHALLDAALDKMEAAKVGRVWNPVRARASGASHGRSEPWTERAVLVRERGLRALAHLARKQTGSRALARLARARTGTTRAGSPRSFTIRSARSVGGSLP